MTRIQDLTFRTNDRKFGLVLPKACLVEILDHCARAGRRETGGLLIGRYAEGLDLAVIRRVTGPPRDSRAGRTWFDRGIEGLQILLLQSWSGHGDYYLGEWHSHPGAVPVPSGRDNRQMKAFAQSREIECPEPILLIVGGDPRRDWTISACVYRRGDEPQEMNEVDAIER
jgi:integrative and conjugative element protein (TIGR02256 family)